MRRLCWLALAPILLAQDPGADLFEKKIRPVLAERCFACHSSKLKSPMGGLSLDSKAGTKRVISDGKLIRALQYADPHLQMPPGGKLPGAVVSDFERWIAAGAPDPRTDSTSTAAAKGIDFEKARQWWSFQPVREAKAPKVSSPRWTRTKMDSFVLAKLDANKLKPSGEADRRSLIRRAYFDLNGLAPSYEEVEAFASDNTPGAYERLIEKLLASPRYGERWGRYWLDVARFGEDNPTTEATNPAYPFSWRYRDWVIEAINKDLPYDRFVKMQFAADLMPGFERDDLRALGLFGAAPTYHKDLRLSKEVIETLATDDWDERVDAVSRGLLGLTVACARCHDHKFDPIPSKDYYAMAGVFASVIPVKRPLEPLADAGAEQKLVTGLERKFWLEYLAKLMTNEPGSKPEESKKKAAEFRQQVAKLDAELPKYDGPFAHAVIDGGVWIDGSDPDLTKIEVHPGTPRDLPVFQRGSVSNPGDIVPRHFLTVLEHGTPQAFSGVSGRLELAERIVGEAAPLAARVFVNRVWMWHFGKPLVGTPSDFGTQGDKPSNPELLDYLAARFIANGWSLKWLHREMMLSSAYRQSSHPNAAGMAADPANRWLWRMNPRRLDIEAWRDAILQASGTLDDGMYGPSKEVDAKENVRRTVYAKVSRARLNTIFKLYDFADPNQHSPAREVTTTPTQQLFVMNSPFLKAQSEALAELVRDEPDDSARVRAMYRRVFGRDPEPKELDLGVSYAGGSDGKAGKWGEYAQALLATNELIFWP